MMKMTKKIRARIIFYIPIYFHIVSTVDNNQIIYISISLQTHFGQSPVHYSQRTASIVLE